LYGGKQWQELKKILTLWEDATLDTASYGSSSDHAKELEREQEIVLKLMKQFGGPIPIPEVLSTRSSTKIILHKGDDALLTFHFWPHFEQQIEVVERKPEVILLLNIYAEVMLCAAVVR
jgi:hypothetical protein